MLALPESHLSLVTQPLGCVITTLAPNGLPQSTAMWFLYDEAYDGGTGAVRFSLLEHRRKFRNLQANPACTFFLMNPDNMGDVIEVRGRAVFDPDPDKSFVIKVREQYGASGPPTDGPDDNRWIVTIDPERINAHGSR